MTHYNDIPCQPKFDWLQSYSMSTKNMTHYSHIPRQPKIWLQGAICHVGFFSLCPGSSRKSQNTKDSQRIHHLGKTWLIIPPTHTTDILCNLSVMTQPNYVPTHLQWFFCESYFLILRLTTVIFCSHKTLILL